MRNIELTAVSIIVNGILTFFVTIVNKYWEFGLKNCVTTLVCTAITLLPRHHFTFTTKHTTVPVAQADVMLDTKFHDNCRIMPRQ